MTAATPIEIADAARERLTGIAAVGTRLGTPPKLYGVLDFAAAAASLTTPCLVVMALGEDVEEGLAPESTESIQRVRTTIATVMGLAARNDAGAKALAKPDGPLQELIREVRDGLVGWVPARRWQPLAIRRSRLVAIEGSRVWWQDDYTTRGRRAGPVS